MVGARCVDAAEPRDDVGVDLVAAESEAGRDQAAEFGVLAQRHLVPQQATFARGRLLTSPLSIVTGRSATRPTATM